MVILIQGRKSANLDQKATIPHINIRKNFIMMLKLQIMFGKHHGVEDRTIGSGQCRLPEAQTERGNFLLHQEE